MSKVWSLVQTVTKDWTYFQKVTKKAFKICPKFGHFFKMCPRSCQRLRHYLEIFWHREREKRTRQKLNHELHTTDTSCCLPRTLQHSGCWRSCWRPRYPCCCVSVGPLACYMSGRPRSAGCVSRWKLFVREKPVLSRNLCWGPPCMSPLGSRSAGHSLLCQDWNKRDGGRHLDGVVADNRVSVHRAVKLGYVWDWPWWNIST